MIAITDADKRVAEAWKLADGAALALAHVVHGRLRTQLKWLGGAGTRGLGWHYAGTWSWVAASRARRGRRAWQPTVSTTSVGT
jgi:hypothetical protein